MSSSASESIAEAFNADSFKEVVFNFGMAFAGAGVALLVKAVHPPTNALAVGLIFIFAYALATAYVYMN